MSEKTQNAFQKYIIPAILAVALIGVILWAAQQKALAESYKNLAKESYVRAYGELTDDLYDMESTLSKLTAVNSPAQYVLLLDEVWRLSGSAVSHMFLPAGVPRGHGRAQPVRGEAGRLRTFAYQEGSAGRSNDGG